jgi:pimeloyl-ACP methyl ester carboxylesterase
LAEVGSLESKFVTIEGVPIHYQETGSGAPLVCIHGAGPGAGSEGNFRNNVAAFAKKFHVILYDMPQFGRSGKVVLTEPRLVYNARILKGFFDALGIENASIVGNSMGGQVALKFGLEYPNLLSRLVIIGSGAVPPVFAPYPVEGVKMSNDFYTGVGPTREKLQILLNAIVYDSSRITEAVFEERWNAATAPDVVELFSRRQGPLPRESLAANLPKLKAKLLTIWGMDDRMGALDVGIQITRLVPDAQMHIFNKCGHWAQIEHADAFNRVVVEFLSE